MKKLALLVILFICKIGFSQFQNGTAKLIPFNNSNSIFKVPEGKTWQIINVFSDCSINNKLDTSIKYTKLWSGDEVRIFIKSIDSTMLTDISILKLGPVIYRGPNHEREHSQPIILPSNTTISFVICSGDWGKNEMIENKELTAFLNLIEY